MLRAWMSRVRQIGWFIGLWLAAVLVVAAVSYGLKLLLP